LALSAVDPSRVGAQLTRWGSYYATQPRVMCVPLADALRAGRSSAAIDATLGHHTDVITALARQLRSPHAERAQG
jgi:esterase/lipase superfamily enzyme